MAAMDSATAAFGSTTGQVLQFIIDGLATGRYEPGQRLNAASLCKELGLSKAPVREALHVLAGEGVIDMPKNRGAIIRDLTRQDLLDLWEAFALTIGREIRLAVNGMQDATARARLLAAMQGIKEERDRGASINFYRALHGFHDAARQCVDNRFIVNSQMLRLAEFWLPYIQRSVPLDTYIDHYVANYQRICNAMIAGDAPTAESAFHYHGRWSAAIIRGEFPDPASPWVG